MVYALVNLMLDILIFGALTLAAIGMTLPLFMVINLFMHGLGIGGSVRYAQLLGAGRREEAVDSFLRVLWLALAASCLLALTVNLFPRQVLRLLGAEAAGEALPPGWVWAGLQELRQTYAVPNAFQCCAPLVEQRLGRESGKEARP